jgi:hypothetical protein
MFCDKMHDKFLQILTTCVLNMFISFQDIYLVIHI